MYQAPVLSSFFFLKGSVTAMSLILPLDTVRSRLLLDDSNNPNNDKNSLRSQK